MTTPLEVMATQLVEQVQAEATRMREAGEPVTRSVEAGFPAWAESVLDIRADYLRAAARKILGDRWEWEIHEYLGHAPDIILKWYNGDGA